MIEQGKRYVVTTDKWFYGPDGQQYRSVWGMCTLQSVEEAFGGFRPQRPSTNWFMRVGSEEKHVLIAGCQIHYVIRCEERPKDDFDGQSYKDKDTELVWKASRLYYAE